MAQSRADPFPPRYHRSTVQNTSCFTGFCFGQGDFFSEAKKTKRRVSGFLKVSTTPPIDSEPPWHPLVHSPCSARRPFTGVVRAYPEAFFVSGLGRYRPTSTPPWLSPRLIWPLPFLHFPPVSLSMSGPELNQGLEASGHCVRRIVTAVVLLVCWPRRACSSRFQVPLPQPPFQSCLCPQARLLLREQLAWPDCTLSQLLAELTGR